MKQHDMFNDVNNINTMQPTDKPQRCHCCGQLVKLYKIQMPLLALADMCDFAKESKDGEYWHINRIRVRSQGGEFAKLRFWGLIEEQFNEKTNKRKSGMWRMTAKGRAFTRAEIMVRKYSKLYNQEFYGHDGGMVTLKQALKERFDYQELMSR